GRGPSPDPGAGGNRQPPGQSARNNLYWWRGERTGSCNGRHKPTRPQANKIIADPCRSARPSRSEEWLAGHVVTRVPATTLADQSHWLQSADCRFGLSTALH